MRIALSLPALFFLSLAGCAPQNLYEWGDYETRLYAYYTDPQELEGLVTALEAAIAQGEKTKRVAPGLYAEYAFLLFRLGEGEKSIEYFKKEKETWPESAVLMDRMISLAHSTIDKTKNQSATNNNSEFENR